MPEFLNYGSGEFSQSQPEYLKAGTTVEFIIDAATGKHATGEITQVGNNVVWIMSSEINPSGLLHVAIYRFDQVIGPVQQTSLVHQSMAEHNDKSWNSLSCWAKFTVSVGWLLAKNIAI